MSRLNKRNGLDNSAVIDDSRMMTLSRIDYLVNDDNPNGTLASIDKNISFGMDNN